MQVHPILPLVWAALALGCTSKPAGDAPSASPGAELDKPGLPEVFDVDCKPDSVDSTCGEESYHKRCSCRDRKKEAEQVDKIYQEFAWNAFVALHANGGEPLWTNWHTRLIGTAKTCTRIDPRNPWLDNILAASEGYDEAPPVHNPIWDQNGNPVEFEVRFVDRSGSAEALKSISDQVRDSCINRLKAHPWGSLVAPELPAPVRLKLAWKKLAGDDKPEDFITDKEGKRGLVALHIAAVTRTTSGWWVWATFGHVDSVPDDAPLVGARPLFFDTTCGDKCPRENECPTDCGGPNERECKTQVKRVTPIPDEIRALNKVRREHLGGTPLAKYQLIGVQRVEDAINVDPKDLVERRRPAMLANEIIEWDHQQSNCIGCHVGMESWGFPVARRREYCDGCGISKSGSSDCVCKKSAGKTATCSRTGDAEEFQATLERQKSKNSLFFQADMFGLYNRVTDKQGR